MFDCDIFKKYKKDIILISIIVMSALVLRIAYVFIGTVASKDLSKNVVVTQDDTMIGRYPLDEDYSFRLDYGESFNEICILNGAVYVPSSGCPDHICEKRGQISRVGESIICLPNRLVITIEGNEKERAYDAITN